MSPRRFAFRGAKEALQSQDPISFEELARELDTSIEKLDLLVKTGYLSLLRNHTIPALRQVGKPGKSALEWLRSALSPIPLAPIVPVSYAMEFLGVKEIAMKTLIMEHNVTVYVDGVLGELMTVAQFHRLFNSVYPWHERTRFDRQMMLAILTGLDSGSGEHFVRPKPYDKAVEEELRRVASLPEEQMILRAMDIYEAYRDAKRIADAAKIRPSQIVKRVDKMMTKWKLKLDSIHQMRSYSSSSKASAAEISSDTSNPSRST